MKDRSLRIAELRARAENSLGKTRREIAAMSSEDVQKIVHELQVHEIELRMQNEELHRTQQELEETCERYADLYDFATCPLLTLGAASEIQEANLYKQHCVDQALTILRSHPNIQCVFTTPKLLEALAEKIDLAHYGIKGIFCGGTELTPQFHRFAREELCPGIDFVPTYGNTLMGLATHKPFDPADNFEIIYHAPQPRAVAEIVEPDNAEKKVDYGKIGRVMLTTLTRETFIPRFLERDQAVRRPPCEPYPWDGAGNVQPFQGLGTTVVEGVY